MTEDDVHKHIIEPMTVTYLPPKHLRYQPEDVQEKALGQYVKALSQFDEETLEQAWLQVLQDHQYAIWPTPGKIARVAKSLARTSGNEQPLNQRAHEMVTEYMAHFAKTSKIYRVAREQGWSGRLLTWVEAAATVQAQLIVGISGVHWDPVLTTDEDHTSSQVALQSLKRRFAKPVEKGKIQVSVPKQLQQQWRQQTSRQENNLNPEIQEVFQRLRGRNR